MDEYFSGSQQLASIDKLRIHERVLCAEPGQLDQGIQYKLGEREYDYYWKSVPSGLEPGHPGDTHECHCAARLKWWKQFGSILSAGWRRYHLCNAGSVSRNLDGGAADGT